LNNQDGSIVLRGESQGFVGFNGDSYALKPWLGGTLTLGTGSVTTVVPDLTDTGSIELGTVVTRYRAGSVDLRGNLIDIQAGATVVVPSGTITAVASREPITGFVPGLTDKELDGSRLYIGENALLSVAGLRDVLLSMESNSVKAELRINELRDSVLYIDSWLRGATVYVDKRVSGTFRDGPMAGVKWIQNKDGSYQTGNWVGTPIGDVSSWLGTGSTNLAELSTVGGKINLKSGGDIVIRAGAVLDIAGGSVRYADGYITTTKLLGADGRIYDIGAAMPDQLYSGFVGSFSRYHNRINGTETWTSPLDRNHVTRFEKGYTEGKDAGGIVIYNAAGFAIEGEIDGRVVTGQHQAIGGKAAVAGSLQLGGGSSDEALWLSSSIVLTGVLPLLGEDFNARSTLPVAFYDPKPGEEYRSKTTYLDAGMLGRSGLGTLSWIYNKTFRVTEDVNLELIPGAKLRVYQNLAPSELNQTTVFIDGRIRAAGGTLEFSTNNDLMLGARALLDVGGQWINEYVSGAPTQAPRVNGGSIGLLVNASSAKLDVVGTVDVAAGAVLDVSGGGWLSSRGGKQKLQVGDAGTLQLTNMRNSDLSGLDMRGYAAGSGASLILSMLGDVQIGGVRPSDPAARYVPGTLFADLGFRSISIITDGDVTVPDGVSVIQTPVGVDLKASNAFSSGSGSKITSVGAIRVLDPQDRVTLSSASISIDTPKTIRIGTGATLATDLKGAIGFSRGGTFDGSVQIDGTIDAPGGTVSIDTGALTLADTGSITARGVAVIDIAPWTGLRTGNVLNGGTVRLSANDIALKAGSLIDVSGASGDIDVPAGRNRRTVNLASNGGIISIEMLGGLIEGRFLGRPGGPGASGGEIRINLKSFGGEAPRVGLQQRLANLDPDCFGYVGNGVCSSSDWTEALGFDFAQLLRDWNFPASGPMIFTREMLAALPAKTGGNIVVSGTASGGGHSAVDAAQFGWTEAVSADFMSLSGFDVRSFFAAAASIKSAVVRPGSLQNGGFANLALTTGGSVVLDGLDLAFTRSIAIDGAIASGGAGTVRLTAPYVSLSNSVAATIPTGAPGAAGTGKIIVSADLIDVTQAAFAGFAETRLETRDLRLGGLLTDLTFDRTAMLFADGKLEVKAGQIYPATGVLATIKAGTQIVIEANGDSALPLSAAGSLTLEASVIEQNGVVRAPFGMINFKASDRVTLGAGSVTSVSGNGLFVPYGALSNGEFWSDPTMPTTENQPPKLARLPEKQITLDSPSINVAAGSVIDIRGGGNLHASEFVVGSGGSHDVLATPGVYAIIPAAGAATAPNSAAAIGSRIWLAGGNGLAAGWYALMPAQYALLPGAFAVQVVAGSAGNSVPKPVTLRDGTVLMSGRVGNALDGATDALTSTIRVMNGNVVRAYSEYNEADANTFFASEAFRLTQYRLTGLDIVTPRLPMDGGAVVFKATSELLLDGQLKSAAADGGRAGLVDIAATNIAVVGAGQDRSGLAGYLIIDSSRLSSFGAASLLIGGVRSGTSAGLGVEVFAGSIVVRNDASSALTGPEIILASSDTISIGAGSMLRADGAVAGGSGNLVIKPQVAAIPANNNTPDDTSDDHAFVPARDYGALIRLSNGDVVSVIRSGVENTAGVVDIGAGAVIAGGKAVMIDATRNTTLASSAQVSAIDITLSGSRIGFGGGNSGLVFDVASLSLFNAAQNLTLRSYSTIDFYSGMDFGSAGLRSVTLDGTALVGYSADATALSGDTVVLRNTSGSLVDPLVVNQGTLTLNANRLVLSEGVKSLRGFNGVTLNAAGQIVGQGDGSLDAGSASVRFTAPIITATNGAGQSITTTGALSVIAAGTAPTRDIDSLGARWAFNAGQIDFGGRVSAIGGSVSLTAASGSVIVGDGAVIDVGGFGKAFNDVTAYADAGKVSLTSVGGSVVVNAGAMLNLAAATGGGDAGTLSAVASGGGTVVLAGMIDAHAQSGKGGSFTLDIGGLPDFAGFSRQLDTAGFTRAREFRIRSGDVALDGYTRVENFVLSTDAGRVNITGTIDASNDYGGNIAISGSNGVAMISGANLIARSTTALGSGRVLLEASGGRLDITGGAIDVAGGDGGKVRFRAQQTSTHDGVAVDNLQVDIRGARNAVLQAVSRYTTTDGTVESQWANAMTDADTFMLAAPGIAARIAGGIGVMAGIEIRSAGDLTLSSTLDLANTFVAHQGSLTLRAAGNLNILGHISDGFSDATRGGALLAQDSWDLRLVGGADIAAADALAVQSIAGLAAGSGSVRIGDATSGYQVRTGTGDIAVRAGRDLQLAHFQSVIYTAGRKDTTSYADFSAPTGAEYGVLGGHLGIAAGGSIISTLPVIPADNMLYTNWLKKAGVIDETLRFNGQQTTWWVDYGKFTQGVGALGGGNVNVQAGGDLDNLLVALATSGRVHGGTVSADDKVLQIDNGGAMAVTAGGTVKAGNYYIARGAATIDAGSFANGRTVSTIVTGNSSPIITGYDVAPVLALGDATFTVRTAGDLRLQTVLDPLLAIDPVSKNPDDPMDIRDQTYMFGYTANSQLRLMSSGGNVTLVNQAIYLSQDVETVYSEDGHGSNLRYVNSLSGNLYPALTHVVALNGSIRNLNQMKILPAAQGDLQLLAADSIDIGNILMSRASSAMLISPLIPFGGAAMQLGSIDVVLENVVDRQTYYGGSQSFFADRSNPDVLLNAGDISPSRIYAMKGSIRSGKLISNEQTWISAGADILDVTLNLRNLHATDVTWVHAGNDFLYHTQSSNAVLDPGITIQGPGGLLLTAGRDVYADTIGIVSTGNYTFMRAASAVPTPVKGLSAAGASIEVMAGLHGQQPDYAAVVTAYLDPAMAGTMPNHLTTRLNEQAVPLYLTDGFEDRAGGTKQSRFGLVSFIKEVSGQTLSPLDAWAAFQMLPAVTQQRFLRQVYMQELRAAGRDHTAGGGTGGYQRGYDAIARLFPGDAWKGNVQSGNLLMRTISGGSIGVYTPGGGLEIAALNQNVEADYGLVTLGYGKIDIFAKQDVVVNRSRVLTFTGGDVTIWSTFGGIDAGRGAKTTRVPSAPIVTNNLDGVTLIKEKSDISGSGIGTVVGFSGVEQGDVDLVAPVGTVDAGDAGIRVSGNFNVAAMFVLNTDNIKVGGDSKGVPKAEAPAVNLSMETKDKVASDAVKDASQQNATTAQPSVIIVEVLGYGGGSNPEQSDDERKRRTDDRQGGLRHDPNSPAHVVGYGRLTDSQKQLLSDEEKRRL
jgi:filamentous hemagglutinin